MEVCLTSDVNEALDKRSNPAWNFEEAKLRKSLRLDEDDAIPFWIPWDVMASGTFGTFGTKATCWAASTQAGYDANVPFNNLYLKQSTLTSAYKTVSCSFLDFLFFLTQVFLKTSLSFP